jgi:hypothetical protein
MGATTQSVPDTLRRAQQELDRRFDEIARQYAGHPRSEVLDVLEHEVCARTPGRTELAGSPCRIRCTTSHAPSDREPDDGGRGDDRGAPPARWVESSSDRHLGGAEFEIS